MNVGYIILPHTSLVDKTIQLPMGMNVILVLFKEAATGRNVHVQRPSPVGFHSYDDRTIAIRQSVA